MSYGKTHNEDNDVIEINGIKIDLLAKGALFFYHRDCVAILF